jgi:hypothetical protein
MIDEPFPDDERQRLLALCLMAVPASGPPDAVMLQIISRLSGTDTQLIARRAYPSKDADALISKAAHRKAYPLNEDWFRKLRKSS